MDMRDPAPGAPWVPQQFWVCPKCGRHFWTTYATATPAPPKKEEPAAPPPPKKEEAAAPPRKEEAAAPAAS